MLNLQNYFKLIQFFTLKNWAPPGTLFHRALKKLEQNRQRFR